MKSKYFKHANVELEKPKQLKREECYNLYVHRNNRGECISKWKASFWERILFLFHGTIWLGVLSGETQPPVWLDCTKNVFQKEPKYTISLPQPNRKRRRKLIRLNKNRLNGKKV